MKECPACKKENEEIAILCEFCRFPFEGDEKEKAIHIGQFITKQKGVKYDSEDSLKRSRKILMFLGILNLLYLIVFYKFMPVFDFILNAVIITMFAWCAITIYKNPVIKLIIPLVILILFGILSVILIPETWLDVLILRGSCIAFLGFSLYLVQSHKKYVEKFEK